MATTRYNPSARATVGPTTSGGGAYPYGDPNARKPHTPGSSEGQRGAWGQSMQNAWDTWGGSGLYVNGVELPWSGPPGQERGMRAPKNFTPDVMDPRNAGYFAGGSTPEQDAARNKAANEQLDAKRAGFMQNEGYAGAIQELQNLGYVPHSRDPKQQMMEAAVRSGKVNNPQLAAALTNFDYQNQAARYPGLTRETWDNLHNPNMDWPKPHAPSSANQNSSVGAPPASPQGVRRGATPTNQSAFVDSAHAPAWTQQNGAPPSANPMFEGYQGGGAGQVSGGAPGGPQFAQLQNALWGAQGGGMQPQSQDLGAWLQRAQGGYNPGASTGSAGLYNDASLYDSPMAAQGRTAPWQGTAPGGRQPIGPFNPTIDPSTRPGSAPSWASAQPGYAPFNPGNFSMPYDTGGMWQMFGGSPMGMGGYVQPQGLSYY